MEGPEKDKLEVERVLNLTQGFGWEKVSEKLDAEFIELTIRKLRASPGPPLGVGPS